jgi:CBS domain-containing membrane protein
MTVLAVRQPDPPDLFYAFLPVGVNSVLLILFGLIFHRFSGRNYPHAPAAQPESLHGTSDAPPPRRGGFVAEDLDVVLAEMHESFDIDRGDLEELLRRLDERTAARLPGSPRCGDIMSRDVVSISYEATTQEARKTMLERRLRCLPLVNRFGVYLGMVEARHLMGEHLLVAAITTSVPVARPETPALAFASALSSGRTHEVVVLDDNNRIVGLITQTDMLAVALRALNRSG